MKLAQNCVFLYRIVFALTMNLAQDCVCLKFPPPNFVCSPQILCPENIILKTYNKNKDLAL